MYDFSRHWADYALYLPAPNDMYARAAAQALSPRLKERLPKGLKPVDLDFLNPRSKLTRWPNVLYTAAFGVKDRGPTIISNRDRTSSFVLGDSGGFSIISGAVKASQASFRAAVLDWQERHCDVGICLDVPTRSLLVPASGYTRFDDCLDRTKKNIEFALHNRTSTSLRLLNVMQGRDHKEARGWCEAVSGYELEGLAIAGHTRLDLWFWIERIIELIDIGRFDRVTHIHFLGTSQPGFAVMATALQRALRKHVRPDITISLDSSLAFRIAQQFGQVSLGMNWGSGNFSFADFTFPKHGDEVDRSCPFPFPSPIGDLCTIGDFLPGSDPYGPAPDVIGRQMISNHAVHVELATILQANRLVDMGQIQNSLVPHVARLCR